jgi:hypothetical protein
MLTKHARTHLKNSKDEGMRGITIKVLKAGRKKLCVSRRLIPRTSSCYLILLDRKFKGDRSNSLRPGTPSGSNVEEHEPPETHKLISHETFVLTNEGHRKAVEGLLWEYIGQDIIDSHPISIHHFSSPDEVKLGTSCLYVEYVPGTRAVIL